MFTFNRQFHAGNRFEVIVIYCSEQHIQKKKSQVEEEVVKNPFTMAADAKLIAFMGFTFCFISCFTVEPLDSCKRYKKDFDPTPYFFRWRNQLQDFFNRGGKRLEDMH